MKPFIISWPVFYIIFLGLLFLTVTLPIPGNDPIPDWIMRQEEIKGRIFDFVFYPAKWAGPAGALVAPAIWATLFSSVFMFLWYRFITPLLRTKSAEQGAAANP
jgi:hypothetical protein